MRQVVVGVADSGKTTLGRALVGSFRWRCTDTEDVHGPAALEQMFHGSGWSAGQRQNHPADLMVKLSHLTTLEVSGAPEPQVLTYKPSCNTAHELHRHAQRTPEWPHG
ncbi:hypothetical protein DEDE109153_10675 [Deinococcus deserti]|uniref:Uncharacterized protein n=1 Tax=Deinococcus deserti (strain DSM 17065 / CIP 109153 / LMG 22923 / VCD115) TaxID=546414 RepID=C1CX40_DEIDV|nr:Hypothetical protein Deide_17801 [Deinococcus deserti VCD115]